GAGAVSLTQMFDIDRGNGHESGSVAGAIHRGGVRAFKARPPHRLFSAVLHNRGSPRVLWGYFLRPAARANRPRGITAEAYQPVIHDDGARHADIDGEFHRDLHHELAA